MMARQAASVVLVPGLRDEAPLHWQSLLAQQLRHVVALPALGRRNIDLAARIEAIEAAVQAARAPVVVVAHSGGATATVHWAGSTRSTIQGALLATPALFEAPLSDEYPALEAFQRHGWLPLPRAALPFRCIVAASRNDALGPFERVADYAQAWGAELVDLGEAGHLNPASGHGDWPAARGLIERLGR